MTDEHSITNGHNILDTYYMQVGSAILSPVAMAQGDVAHFGLSGTSMKTQGYIVCKILWGNGGR